MGIALSEILKVQCHNSKHEKTRAGRCKDCRIKFLEILDAINPNKQKKTKKEKNSKDIASDFTKAVYKGLVSLYLWK